MMRSAIVTLKTVERCNIDCSYCYFFNSPNQNWKKHPPYIPLGTLEKIAQFFKKGCDDLAITHLTISLHGGEPLMQKKRDFSAMCTLFKEVLGNRLTLNFSIQTNAMLIDEEWIDLFKKYKIGVGISIDGPAEYHDKFRIDHRGKGTHSRVIEKIALLNNDSYFKNKLSALCVINPDNSAEKIYRHFIDDLNINSMDFIFPDYHYQSLPPFTPETLFKFVEELFYAWKKSDYHRISINFFDAILSLLDGNASTIYGMGKLSETQLPLISIASNGDLSPTDEIAALSEKIAYSGASVFNTDWQDYINFPIFAQIIQAQKKLPNTCQRCHWQAVCKGGGMVNRYSSLNNFDNPSIYCDTLQNIFALFSAKMIQAGYNANQLIRNLQLPIAKAASSTC